LKTIELIGRYGNEASRSHSDCDTEQSGEVIATTGLLLYFIRIKREKRDYSSALNTDTESVTSQAELSKFQ
jgi:hypothetical protein